MNTAWQTKKLGDVCDFEGGAQPPKSEFVYEEKPGYVRFLQIRDFGSDKNITYIRQAKKNRLCKENDILIGRYGASVGKILTDKFGAYNVAIMKTLPNLEVLDRSWFYNYLISDAFQRPLLNVADRSAQAGFSKVDIYNFSVPVPPLPEQQRIAAILDEAFDGIATANANAKKNLQNARALFESHLQSVFTQRGKGWVDKQLGDVCELFQGLCINAKTKHLLVKKSSLPLLRIKDLRTNSVEQFVAETGWPKNAQVNESEIIYTRTGQIGLVFRGRVGVLHNNCFKVRPQPVLNSDYLFWWLQNPAFRARITTLASKAAQPDITHSLFKVQPILLPPRDYQDRAITLIDGMRQETQRLVHLYERKLAALEALKKSLLHQAFTGQL